MAREDRYKKCSQCGADLRRVGYNISRFGGAVLCLPCNQKQSRQAERVASEGRDGSKVSHLTPWDELLQGRRYGR